MARGGPSVESGDVESVETHVKSGAASHMSIVTVQDIKDMENPDPIIPQTVLEDSISKHTNSSLRIRSGGFIPFVLVEDPRRRSSSAASIGRMRAETGGVPGVKSNWLLGFKIDEEDGYVREGSTPSY